MSAFLEPLSSCNEQAWVVIVCMDRLRSRVIYKFVCRARRSRVVYEFVCAGCNACYVGETCRHFSTRVREHLVSDRASHIFKHLQDSAHCRALCSADNFHVLDHASTGFQLKIKEAIHIQREQPSLKQPCKSKIILLILTLSCYTSFLVVTIYYN